MKIALTGGTGFIGRYIISEFGSRGDQLKCWRRSNTPVSDFDSVSADIQWVEGDLATCQTAGDLVEGCDAVIHNAFWRPGERFQGEEGDIVEFVQTNLVGTLKLIEAARSADVKQFLFVSTCAVHEKILDDRALDEKHPLWPRTHYGAHKAAIEKFVHSYGLGHGFNIGAVRPTGVYGLHHDLPKSKWFDLVRKVVRNEPVDCSGGGKEVHASDVAKSLRVLLDQNRFQGEAFSCYDRYVSQFEVAAIAKELSGSESNISGQMTRPKHEIDASKIKSQGMAFGGDELLRATIGQMVDALK